MTPMQAAAHLDAIRVENLRAVEEGRRSKWPETLQAEFSLSDLASAKAFAALTKGDIRLFGRPPRWSVGWHEPDPRAVFMQRFEIDEEAFATEHWQTLFRIVYPQRSHG